MSATFAMWSRLITRRHFAGSCCHRTSLIRIRLVRHLREKTLDDFIRQMGSHPAGRSVVTRVTKKCRFNIEINDLWVASTLVDSHVRMIVLGSKDALEIHSKLLSALANHKRLQIMQIISEQEVGVGDLAKKVGLSQSALSQHLARLRNEQLVVTRRDAQNVYYSTNHAGVRTILNSLKSIGRSAPEDQPKTKIIEMGSEG